MTHKIVRFGIESGLGDASVSFFIRERIDRSTSAADATAPRLHWGRPHRPAAAEEALGARIVERMEPLVPDDELDRLESSSPEDRAAALEDFERRLRAHMDDDAEQA